MRRITFFICALLVATSSLWAYDFEVDGLYYNVLSEKERTVEVTEAFNGYSGDIKIPAKVTNNDRLYKVTTIGECAFEFCDDLIAVTIPNSVTTIGDYAFFDCTCLTSVTIPNSVIAIGSAAFSGCEGLTSVTIPNSVTTIGEGAFIHCEALTSVIIPNGVTTIEGWTFESCTSLTTVIIPNSVTTIGESAFEYCESLTSLTIGNSVTTIGEYAFSSCTSLDTVIIPNSVITIGFHAFEDCTSLTSVTIGNNVTTIGGFAFVGCTSLTSITIPNSVREIGEGPFVECAGLVEIVVENSNPNYTSVDGVLFNKDKTQLIQYPEAKLGNHYTIPNSVSSIGGYAFSGSTSLTSVTIGNSVTEIGEMAFNGCHEIKTVYSKAQTPPAITTNTFAESAQQNAILYVPTGCIEQYEAIDGWFAFWDIREFDFLGIEDNLVEDVTISVQNGAIVVNGINEPVTIEVYTLNGQLLYRGSDTTIPMNERGTYLVRVGNHVEKVVL